MSMNYEELIPDTRQHMLREFQAEQAGQPYVSKALSPEGVARFPDLMRAAIERGDETTLEAELRDPTLWDPREEYTRNGITRTRQRNIPQAAHRLALSEFSTWYVRGLAAKLLAEGVAKVQVYRGAQPKWEPGECSEHEGMTVDVQVVYDGHRKRYWPEPGDNAAFSIPFSPGCHHVIRRLP